MFRTVALCLLPLVALALPLPVLAQTAAVETVKLNEMTKTEFNGLIREYLLANPEVLVEAMTELDKRQTAQREEVAKKALDENYEALISNPGAPIMGNKEGDVTMVEFFDYNCGYCKAVFPDVIAEVEADKNLKVMFIEFPILSESSRIASLAALAANRQDKYVAMHQALMSHKGALDDATIDAIAKDAGVDVTKMREDMKDEALAQQLADNRAMAEKLSIQGTPAMVIGRELVPGAIPRDRMKELIAKARQAG